MFPLGLALVPGAVLPLHIFEPRYRALVHDALAGDADFGVVLIERGREVGGGETRSGVGTIAHIADGHAFDDGRYALVCVGTERFRVVEWLADDPYPRARIEPWPDEPDDAATEARRRVEARLEELAAERARRHIDMPAVELDADPSIASYQAVVLAGLGPFDTQRALTCPGVGERLALVDDLVVDAIRFLELGDGL